MTPTGPASTLLDVWVRPGASRTAVGGEHDGALVVAVTAKAEAGAATEAVVRAVAEALGLRPREVRLARGPTSRRKLLEVDLPAPELRRRRDELAARGR